jgi:predicted DNA-binding transcriptional regulator AlpA
MPEAESDPYLDTVEVAQMIGVTYHTVRFYLQQARANRKAGTPKPADLPEPDRVFGRAPAWRRSTIEAWVATRPGKPGRPSTRRSANS